MSSASAFDFDAAKRMVARLGDLLNQSGKHSPEDAEAILYFRAELLAAAAVQQQDQTGWIEVIIVGLAGESFAIETEVVQEVIRPPSLAALPGTPDYVAGVMNFHGVPLLVVDGRVLLGLDSAGTTEAARVVVIGKGRAEFCLLTDSTENVTKLDVSRISDTPESLPEETRRWVRGVTSDAIIVFDTASLLEDPRLWIDELED